MLQCSGSTVWFYRCGCKSRQHHASPPAYRYTTRCNNGARIALQARMALPPVLIMKETRSCDRTLLGRRKNRYFPDISFPPSKVWDKNTLKDDLVGSATISMDQLTIHAENASRDAEDSREEGTTSDQANAIRLEVPREHFFRVAAWCSGHFVDHIACIPHDFVVGIKSR